MRRVLLVATVGVLVATAMEISEIYSRVRRDLEILLLALSVLFRSLLAMLKATLCRRSIGTVALLLILLPRSLVVLLRIMTGLAVLWCLSVLRCLLVVVIALLRRVPSLGLLVTLLATVALLRVLLVRILVAVVRHCRVGTRNRSIRVQLYAFETRGLRDGSKL